MRLTAYPGHSSPAVAVGGMHLPEGRRHDLDPRMLLHDPFVDHPEEGAGVELRLGGDLAAGNAKAVLKVLFIANQDIDVVTDPPQHIRGAAEPAGTPP